MESSSHTAESLPNRDRTLVIMAKAPRPGVVKTRLASSLSPGAVTAFYCCLLNDTLALARSLADVEVAIMCPDTDVSELSQIAGSDVRVVAQKGDGLAAGLISVFAHFAQKSESRVVAFNSDSPHLPRSWDQHTTEVTISWGQMFLIPRFLRAMEWAQAMRWRTSYRAPVLLTYR